MLTAAWYTAILATLGAVSVGHTFRGAPSWPRRLTGVAVVCSALLVVIVALRLWAQTYDAFGGDQPLEWSHASVILFETSWGDGWLWQAAGSVLTLVAAWSWRSRWTRWALATIVASGMAFATAFTGHAMAMEDRLWMTVTAHGLHVVAAGWWLGGLAVIQLVTTGTDFDRDTQARLALAEVIGRFSPAAIAAVAVLTMAGGVATWRHVIEPAGVEGFASPYGLALLGKVAAFVLAGLCGLYNWKVLRPQLTGSPEAARQLRALSWLEVALGLVAVVLTAVLGTLSMPEPQGSSH